MQSRALPLKLTDDIVALIEGAVESGNIMLLATVDQRNQPVLSFRGSIAVFGPDRLSFWARNAQGGTIEAIRCNPQVSMMYRSKDVPMLEFRGRARVTEDPHERNKAFEISHERERIQDPERKGTAVIVDLDQVSGVLGFNENGPIWCLMQRDAAL